MCEIDNKDLQKVLDETRSKNISTIQEEEQEIKKEVKAGLMI